MAKVNHFSSSSTITLSKDDVVVLVYKGDVIRLLAGAAFSKVRAKVDPDPGVRLQRGKLGRIGTVGEVAHPSHCGYNDQKKKKESHLSSRERACIGEKHTLCPKMSCHIDQSPVFLQI